MKEQVKKNHMSSLAPLLLFVVFTTCIIIVLLTGADVYQKLSQRDLSSSLRRTAAQYLTTRLRQSDMAGMLSVGNFDDATPQTSGDTLYIHEEFGGRTFHTRIYCHEGYLRELFALADLSFEPKAGIEILEIKDLHFSLQGDLLLIDIAYSDDTTETLVLYMRSGEEGNS